MDSPDSETHIRVSNVFPEGYGDLILLSKDDVRFYFPSSVLAHASGFFRDMFDTVNKANSPQLLSVKEHSSLLKQFLSHIDPLKPTPRINVGTIASLLETARFYQVPSVIPWFQEEVFIDYSDVRGRGEVALIHSHPLLVLGLAFKLGLYECVQRATQELIFCHIDKWNEEVDIPYPVIRYCRQLRDAHVQNYRELVETLTNYEISNAHKYKDVDRRLCMGCSVRRARWTFKLLSIAVDNPRWSIFKQSYDSENEVCTSCRLAWSLYKEKPYLKWVNRVRPESKEQKLPDLPMWLRDQLHNNSLLNP